jgi:hypothetical protein
MALSNDDELNATATSASVQISTSPVGFYGLVVLASSSGLVSLYDALSATGTAIFTKTLSAGEVITFGGKAIRCNTGLYLTLTSGTMTVRVLHK